MHFRQDFKCLVIAESAANVCSWLSSVSSFGGMYCLICSASCCVVLPTYICLQLHVHAYTIELFESVGVFCYSGKCMFRWESNYWAYLWKRLTGEQVQVAMGSPFGPVLANIFVGYCETKTETEH